jgi:exosortase/archaeosortase family protein
MSTGDTLFTIHHHGNSFALSIVSACSGVNGVVGFLLVGSAFAAIVRGPIVRKILWLVGGMALLWILNLARITFIFFAGKEWGESVALNIFHPFIGIALFIVGVIVMILLIRPLGMRIQIGREDSADTPDVTAAASSAVAPRVARNQKPALAVPKVYLAAMAVVVAALFLGVNNVGLSSYNLVADVAGQAKLDAFVQGPVAPQGWLHTYETTFTWAKPLFGDTSIWNRYSLSSVQSNPLQTRATVVADVVNTPDLSSFSAFGVENCYTFHGYALADVTNVSLVGGITGQAMSYTSQQFGSWSIVYWIVPVKMDTGPTNYERTVLYVKNSGQGVQIRGLTAPASLQNLGGGLNPSNEADHALINNRTFLVAFADNLIHAQSHRSALVDGGSSGIST